MTQRLLPFLAGCVIVLVLGTGGSASAKPPKESKDAAAARLERKALQHYVSGDSAGAVRMLEQALRSCEGASGCSAKTKSHLRVSLGTVRGVGENDYAGAKKEFVTALALDPDAKLSSALSNQQLESAFEQARAEIAPTPKPTPGETPADKPPEKPPEKPAPTEKPPEKPGDHPLSVSEILHPEEHGQTTTPSTKPKPEAQKPTGPEPKRNWVSASGIADFAYLTDANICSPGAPASYFCTDETGAHYAGRPQPNDDVTSGFALSTGRIVLGYERLFGDGLTLGGFAGFAFPFGGNANGRSGMFPLHLEARATYVFGDKPYTDQGDQFQPYAMASVGLAEFDSHVVIRVYEIPCQSKVSPACKHDLDAYRRVGRVFGTVGGGVRIRVEGPHAVRAGMRATLVFGDSAFFLSPELGYELGF